jgi:hypothetical protein
MTREDTSRTTHIDVKLLRARPHNTVKIVRCCAHSERVKHRAARHTRLTGERSLHVGAVVDLCGDRRVGASKHHSRKTTHLQCLDSDSRVQFDVLALVHVAHRRDHFAVDDKLAVHALVDDELGVHGVDRVIAVATILEHQRVTRSHTCRVKSARLLSFIALNNAHVNAMRHNTLATLPQQKLLER